MIRVILTIAIGMSGIFIATALNQPTPAISPAPVPCQCPGEPQ